MFPAEIQLLRDKNNIESRNKIVVHYIPYVRKLASHYEYNREDLFGEWMLWLVRAIDTYDEQKCTGNFIGYAKQWIYWYMYVYMSQAGMIELPNWVAKAMNVYHQAVDMFINVHKREPSNDEIIKILNWPESKLKSVLTMKDSYIRLDYEIPNGDWNRSTTIGDLLPGDEDIEDDFNTDFILKLVEKSLKLLEPHEYEVITLKFYSGMTYQQIADKLSTTRQRIQQLEQHALLKLQKYNHDLLWDTHDSTWGVHQL